MTGHRDDGGRRAATQWGMLLRLNPFVRPHAVWLALTLANALKDVGVRVLMPYLLQSGTDTVVVEGPGALYRWFTLAAAVIAVDAAFTWVGRNAAARYTARTIRDLRDRVTAHIQRLPVAFLDAQHTGDLVARLNGDVARLEGWLTVVVDLLYNALVFVAGTAYMLTISWKLLLVSSVLMPVSAVLMNRITKPMEAASRQQAEGEGRLNAAIQDALAGIVMVKALNLRELLGARFRGLAREVERQALKLDWRRAIAIAVFLALRYTPQLVVPLYGGHLAFQSEITVGQLLAANLVIWMVFQPVESLLNALGRARETLPAAERVFAVLDATPEQQGRPFAVVPGAAPVAFEGVSFGYVDGVPVLRDVTFAAAAGETVALVGPSGCGKSTVLRLLCGFYTPHAGRIRVFGNDLADTDLTAVRERMSLVAQDAYLFPTTIAENIAYGRPGATEAEIIAAARAANAHDFILEQPEGYRTQTGERGAKLSGGQRQRIALARAILKDAPVLLLDEPTSALDPQSEALVQEALERFMAGRTVLVIAHRLTTIQGADRVLVLGPGAGAEQGATLCEAGDHASLMAGDTLYRRLYLRQLSAGAEEEAFRG